MSNNENDSNKPESNEPVDQANSGFNESSKKKSKKKAKNTKRKPNPKPNVDKSEYKSVNAVLVIEQPNQRKDHYERAESFEDPFKYNGFGRPSKYFPEYCQYLIEHMSSGYTYESFAGKIGITFKTMYNWEKEYPDFLHAKEHGHACRLLFYDMLLVAKATGAVAAIDMQCLKWILINSSYGYSDETKQNVSSENEDADRVLKRAMKLKEEYRAKQKENK